jgi:type IV secretion system protein TrbG
MRAASLFVATLWLAFATIAQASPAPRIRTDAIEALAAANAAARQRPTPDRFQGARAIYAFMPGAIYELITQPGFISTILLEPGETLHDIAAGDTSRWTVTEARAEGDVAGRTIVMVKPRAAGLRTNIILITSRRTYAIEAVSQTGRAYSSEIAWTYAAPAPAAAAEKSSILTTRYRIRAVRSAPPRWMPTQVFDDGRQSWIEFPPGAAQTELPPLFVLTPQGAELANYRLVDGRYRIDRIFDRAELRLGGRAPVVVRIERITPRAAVRGGRP